MISCSKCQESLLEALYDELEPEPRYRVEKHLASCPSCSRSFAGLQSTLQLLQLRKRPEPDDAFWNGVWGTFVNRVGEPAVGSAVKTTRIWDFPRRWVFQWAAALVLIVAGLWVGQYLSKPAAVTEGLKPHPVAPSHPRDPLDVRLERHLERSKVLLLGLANLDPNHEDIGSFDFTPERTLCKELIRETYTLKPALAQSGNQRAGELLSDLEVILLQISNHQNKDNSFGLELAKTGIRRKAILFQINLEETRRTADKASTSGRRSEKPRRTLNLG
jgi:hypothetical protein